MTLRTRLFVAIALTVVLCVGLTVGVGLVLTRRAVDRATLRDVSHQADLVARSQDVKLVTSPLTNLPMDYFARQHMTVLKTFDPLPQWAKDRLKRGKPVDGSLGFGGEDQFFAARNVSGREFVLMRPKSVTGARWTPFVYSLLLAAASSFVLAAIAAFLLARRISLPVRRVAAAAGSLARGTQPDPVPVEGARELRTLATAFNDLASQLRRAREAERNFLLSVSHELKTPLTAIRGYAEAIEDGAMEPLEAAGIVAVEAARLERLVRDLLDLARMNRTDFSVHLGEIDLTDVAEDAVRRYQQQADAFGVELGVVADGFAPAIGDADRVLQVISNLVENALRLTPAGGEVRVVTKPGEVWVEDTGPGLEESDREHAFERFYLHERYGRERPVGTGLGLAIVKELTAAMGGTVSVDSDPGRRTRFRVRLQQPARVVSRA